MPRVVYLTTGHLGLELFRFYYKFSSFCLLINLTYPDCSMLQVDSRPVDIAETNHGLSARHHSIHTLHVLANPGTVASNSSLINLAEQVMIRQNAQFRYANKGNMGGVTLLTLCCP